MAILINRMNSIIKFHPVFYIDINLEYSTLHSLTD